MCALGAWQSAAQQMPLWLQRRGSLNPFVAGKNKDVLVTAEAHVVAVLLPCAFSLSSAGDWKGPFSTRPSFYPLAALSCHCCSCSPWKCHSNSSIPLKSHVLPTSILPFLDCVEKVGWRKSEGVLGCHGTCSGHTPVLLPSCMSWLLCSSHLKMFLSLTALQIVICSVKIVFPFLYRKWW